MLARAVRPQAPTLAPKPVVAPRRWRRPGRSRRSQVRARLTSENRAAVRQRSGPTVRLGVGPAECDAPHRSVVDRLSTLARPRLAVRRLRRLAPEGRLVWKPPQRTPVPQRAVAQPAETEESPFRRPQLPRDAGE